MNQIFGKFDIPFENVGVENTLHSEIVAIEVQHSVIDLQNLNWIDFIKSWRSGTKLFTIDDRKVSSHILQPGRPKLHIVKIPTQHQRVGPLLSSGDY